MIFELRKFPKCLFSKKVTEISAGAPEISTEAEYSASYFRKFSFFGLHPKILEIRKKHEYIKCEEFFSGQDDIKILAEISVAAEISTKNRFFVEYSAATEISAKIFLRKCPEKNCAHFIY